MAYRPYPNADRALRQLDRHDSETPPMGEPLPVSPLQQRIAEAFAPWASLRMKAAQPTGREFAAGLKAAFTPPVDTYRLSSR
ncbi:hypothetical protein [Streptomyces sp. NPDC047990]|uniref:hypothetical protein n=1 Tax=Streptomyces sp. NPDC047990 TaxID=3365496 RepID=UPI003724A12C